jgi:hypothetical protein
MELRRLALRSPIRSIRGINTSDPNQYASRLAENSTTGTFFNRDAVRCANPPEEVGKYDFLISSEVFEHVMAPGAGIPQCTICQLPSGAVFTVPYSVGVEPTFTICTPVRGWATAFAHQPDPAGRDQVFHNGVSSRLDGPRQCEF